MKIDEVIKQLESLKENQKDFVEKEEITDVFYRDIILSLDYEKNTKKDIKNVMYELYNIYKKEI